MHGLNGRNRRATVFLNGVLGLGLLLTGCAGTPSVAGAPLPTGTPTAAAARTALPAAAVTPANTPLPADPLPEQVGLAETVPPGLRAQLHLPQGVQLSEAGGAPAQLDVLTDADAAAVNWVYALAAPFPTALDGVSLNDLLAAWRGQPPAAFKKSPLLLSADALAAFSALWGQPAAGSVRTLPADQLLDEAWKRRPSWALIPFEALQPRWKVLAVDGQSPVEKGFDPARYPLTLRFGWRGDAQAVQALNRGGWLPQANWHADQLTVLVMTGTTALVRNTAARMETEGVTYPGRDIQAWLRDADLAHISNEIAFADDCPPAVPVRSSMKFCSDPRYIELFDFIGVDIVELTGNHVLDWGEEAFRKTLALYREHNWPYYGGGENLEEARRPLLVAHNGTRLAFLGCNATGPVTVWAREDAPGAAPCDRAWMQQQVSDLTRQGYQVIVTFQHLEDYNYQPAPPQRGDFQHMAEAGAVIVSGSQAHFPQTMTFEGGSFVHYGLSNLFFDQMDTPVRGNRREVLDRHVFYAGRYISTQILTAYLEDYARPRPMTPAERDWMLHKLFRESGWEN